LPVLSPKKTGLLQFSESPVISTWLSVSLATRLTRPWVPWLSVPPLQVVWHYLRLCLLLCQANLMPTDWKRKNVLISIDYKERVRLRFDTTMKQLHSI
jgi:hypothetical protein